MDTSNTKALYEALPFPQRNVEDESNRLITPPPDHLGKVNHFCFSGTETFGDNFRALVAGGGTGDAAIYLAEQLSKRGKARVTYLDQSSASMEIAKNRADSRGLTNIDWINGSILDVDVGKLGKFNYINCVGVIHHLHNPIDGLHALNSLLEEGGAICLMVYGRYGRQDITDVRELFSTYKQVAERGTILTDAKEILSSLSPKNSYMRGRDRKYVLDHLFGDLPDLADIFLNPVEHTYSAKELAELIEDEIGLTITRFTSYDGAPAIMSLQYNPDLMISSEPVRKTLKKLSLRERWKIAEIIDGSMHLHCAYVMKNKAVPADFKNNKLVPCFVSEQQKQLISVLHRLNCEQINLKLSNGAELPLSISIVTLEFLLEVDNEKSIQDILSRMQLARESAGRLLKELSLLAELEWIYLRTTKVQPFLIINNGQTIEKSEHAEMSIDYEQPVFHMSQLNQSQ